MEGTAGAEFMPKRENDPKIEKAKKICRRCPVRSQCLQEALENDWVQGVWGGTTDNERKVARILMGGRSYAEVQAEFQEGLGQTS